MRLLLVRHAESEGNSERRLQGHADFRLSEKGRRQAEALRDRLGREGFAPTHAYTSPLLRSGTGAATAPSASPSPGSVRPRFEQCRYSNSGLELPPRSAPVMLRWRNS